VRKFTTILIAAVLLAGCSTAAKAPEPACAALDHDGATHNSKPVDMYKVPQAPAAGARVAIPCMRAGLVEAPGEMQGWLEQRGDGAATLVAEESGWTFAGIMAERKPGAKELVTVTYVGYDHGKVVVEYAVGPATGGAQAGRLDPAAVVRFLTPANKADVDFRRVNP
jgi:hypothetical protein